VRERQKAEREKEQELKQTNDKQREPQQPTKYHNRRKGTPEYN